MEISLREYQREGIKHLLKHHQAGLFYDPGLGKTLTTLLAFMLMAKKRPGLKMIIFAPLRIAQTVWQDEIEKWDDTRHLTITFLHGSKKKKLLEEARETDITVINYEGIKWLTLNLPMADWFWDIAVFDELSKLKDMTTDRHKRLRRVIKTFDRRIGLTGTPAPNSLLELFGQMMVLDDGAALGTSLHRFQQTYFYRPFPTSYDWVLRKGARDIIAQRVESKVHRLDAETHLDMPERVDVWHDLRMSPSQQAVYDTLEEDSIVSFAGGALVVNAVNAAVLYGKLHQIAQGFVYASESLDRRLATDTPGDQRVVRRFDTTKLDALEDIVEEAAGTPLLVMYKFQEDLAALQERFPEARTLLRNNTVEIVTAWNDKEIPLLFANPQSAGHGLNLQQGGHIMVYYTLESSNERYIQANGRLHRQGQTQTVIIHHLNMVNTVDDDIRQILKHRATMQQLLLARISALRGGLAFEPQEPSPSPSPSPEQPLPLLSDDLGGP